MINPYAIIGFFLFAVLLFASIWIHPYYKCVDGVVWRKMPSFFSTVCTKTHMECM